VSTIEMAGLGNKSHGFDQVHRCYLPLAAISFHCQFNLFFATRRDILLSVMEWPKDEVINLIEEWKKKIIVSGHERS
jgi:hypothetical protein